MNTSRPTQNCMTLSRSMGIAALLLISLTTSLFSQGGSITPSDQQTPPQNVIQTLSPESLQQLLAPIALYPDALIALILPASTVPSDIVLASRYLAANGDPQNIPNQPWDNSVKSLASYPQVVTWMDQNLQWTTTLGEAFIAQQADVMSAIQQLRAQAQLAGNLVDTPQQRIVKENTVIRIVPAEPDYLYVPQYDPELVYVQPYSQDIGPLITFGVGFAVGAWLNYDCDWNHHQIYRGDWQPGWNAGGYQNGGNQGGNNTVNVVNINQSSAQPWQPSPQSSQQLARQQQNFARINSSLPANTQAASGVTAAAAMTHPSQINSQIPRPSRVNFVNASGTKNNPVASSGHPVTMSPQAVQANKSAFQPTTPPQVAGQSGKPLSNFNAQSPNQSVKKHSAKQTQPSAPMSPAPVIGQNGEIQSTTPQHKASTKHTQPAAQMPPAPVIGQNGEIQSTTPQHKASTKHTQPSTAPAIGQNGANQSTTPQHTPSAKHHHDAGAPQASSAPQSFQGADAQTHHKIIRSEPQPSSVPVPQVQSHQSSQANNPRPQQAPEAPKHHAAVSTPNAAPQQQRPPQAAPQQQRPQQQPQVHKSEPPAQINKAPAANPAQSQPSGKNPDKKKKDETQLQ